MVLAEAVSRHGSTRSCTALYEAAPPAVGSTGTMGRARAAGATRRRMHISAPSAARPFEDRGPRAGRRSCATRSEPTRVLMRISAPPAAGSARGPWAASGPEELRDSERSHGCRRAAVTVCLQYLVPQVTVSDVSTIYSELARLHYSELDVEIRILPFCRTEVLKEDSLRSSRNSVQALLESRYCIPSTRFNRGRAIRFGPEPGPVGIQVA